MQTRLSHRRTQSLWKRCVCVSHSKQVSHKQVSHSCFQPTARAFATAVTHKQLVQLSSELTFSPCRSFTIFDLGTELTEYKCQSVSTPVPKGSEVLFPPLRQGGSDPFSSHCLTKTLLIGCDIRRGRSLNVPAEVFASCHPPFPRFGSWFFHDTSPTNWFPPRVSCR